ncbi:hypothetical protein OROHE_010706 [Orobanche hederae]
MGRHNSGSPVRTHGSPRSRRERSPAQRRSSNRDKLPSRNRSRSPVYYSPVRDKKPYNPTKSPERRKSPPARARSPVRQKPSNRTRSPEHEMSRSSPPLSPLKEKPSSRTRSPKRVKSRSSVSQSPEKGKPPIRNRSPRRARSRSPHSPSLSPRSKRLKRVRAERDVEKGNGREYEKKHVRKGDRHEEKDLGRDSANEKKDRRSERDAVGNGSRSRHRRSSSPSDRNHRGGRRSRSPLAAENRGRNEVSVLTDSRDHEHRNGDSDSLAKMKAVEETLDVKEKQKPSFELSGKLAAETNRVRGVTLLFNEPPEARQPDTRWRLYVFKGGEVLNVVIGFRPRLPTSYCHCALILSVRILEKYSTIPLEESTSEPLYVHRQSYYLFGRERRVADIPTDHPSCSKQHAVLQYRQVEEENRDGTMSKRVRPYLMDLGSTNGTFINDNQMEPQRYYELFEKDTIKFGNSSREYVLLHENSTG